MIRDNLAVIVADAEPIYHGSGTSGIRQFREADEDTIGKGAYFTSEAVSAEGYAKGRARQTKGMPVVYSVCAEGLKFLDLRDRNTLDVVMDGFTEILGKRLKEPLKWNVRAATERAIDAIRKRDYTSGSIRNVTWSHCELFSRYLQSLGYDGLIAYEGGEGNYVRNHDTWLVFSPSHLRVIAERTVA